MDRSARSSGIGMSVESAASEVARVDGWAAAKLYLAQLGAALRSLARNRLAVLGATIIFIGVVMALFAPILATYDPYDIDVVNRLKGPTPEHWLGSDYLGRDTYSRIIWGARTAFQVAIAAVTMGALLGVPLGAAAGFFGRWADAII